MSVEASVWAWKKKLPANQKLVLLALANNVNDCGLSTPDLNRVALACGMHKLTVKKHIVALREEGYLRIIKRTEDTTSLSNHYQLTINKIPCECNHTHVGGACNEH